ncbi:ArdC-like ssDNA-binding domain-containing protein [Fusobacterium ulcerans]|uniref:ArdC-like ssDNA-binding domain-containing protein n=1 Tax=Fusobacterium ulcerans TaxID=861 RepID=UPI003FEF1A0F
MKEIENSFQKVLEELKAGIDIKIKDFVDNSQELKEFIKFRRKHFYSYSVRNSILIYKQNPLASFVAGYKKWEELGYYVSKGSKGIKILIPLIRKNEEEETKELCVYGYKYCNVFDISQTEAGENAVAMPSIDTRLKISENSQYNAEKLYYKTKEIIEQYVSVEKIKNLGRARGMTDGEKIYVVENDYTAMAGTLVHEFIHFMNHFKKERKKINKNEEETEAELGAMIYGSYFNLDVSGKYKYLAGYRKGVDLGKCFNTALKTFELPIYGNEEKKGLNDILMEE